MPYCLVRLALVLALPPALAACGTLRLYEGEPRSRDEAARVHEMVDIFSLSASSKAVATACDGKALGSHSESTLELLPGPHAIDVEGRALGVPVVGTLRFTAEAGGEYQMMMSTGSHSRGGIVLYDERAERVVADTEPTAEQARSAELDLGPDWHVVDWYLDDVSAGQFWVPVGESKDAWRQSVSLGAQRAEGGEAAAVLDAEVEQFGRLARDRSVTCEVLDAGPTHRQLRFHQPDAPEWSLTCIRVHDGVLHRMSWSARDAATWQADESRWRAAFLAAPLSFPGD